MERHEAVPNLQDLAIGPQKSERAYGTPYETRRTAPDVRTMVLANSTPLPNFFLDAIMPRVPHATFKVLLLIWRKTVGWQKKSDLISLSQIQKGTGVGRDVAITAAQFWERIGLLTKKRGAGYRGVNEYSVVLDFDKERVVAAIESLVEKNDQSNGQAVTSRLSPPSLVGGAETQKAPVSTKRAKQKAQSISNSSLEGQYEAQFSQIPRI
jgi:hypothetical protein